MFFRQLFRSRSTVISVALSLAGLALARQGFVVEPDSLVVREYRLDLPSWPAALHGFRIAAVGDLHAGSPHVDEGKLEEVVRRVSAANPDLIVWLGDYVIHGVLGGRFMTPEQVAAILSKARARHGQVAIIGNHDRWLDSVRVERAFEGSSIPFLRWRSQTLLVNDVPLHIYGLDDFELSPHYWRRFEATREEWRKVPVIEPILVLSHNPDVFPSIPSRVALTLASHTHGGQVRLPFLGSLIVPSSFGQRFARGHIVEEGRHLFVNTGIGTSIIPVRLGVPPEISVLTVNSGGGALRSSTRD
jgi:predicted MPP superfamily phosphohydrolase